MRERIALATLLAAASPTVLAAPEGGTLQFSGAVQARTCEILVNGTKNLTTYTLPSKTVEDMNGTSRQLDSVVLEVKCPKKITPRVTIVLAPGARAEGKYLLNTATVDPAENMALFVSRHYAGGYLEDLYLGDRSYSWMHDSHVFFDFRFANRTPSKDRPVSAGNYETALQYTVEYL